MNISDLYQNLKQTNEFCEPKYLKKTRKRLYRLTQVAFADLLNIPSKTYVNWEQGRYTPCASAQILLYIATYKKKLFLENREDFVKKIKSL
ncbi:MAG: hypothetical protein DGJ47_000691 [Rickettsiaceae bacterium]